jgi:predicted NUDIX family NTP pyrophosphohydrolase
MPQKQSAGILLYRFQNKQLQVFIVHPGGPFWKNKDQGAWSIPKGEFTDVEDPLATAVREFAEETGQKIDGEFNSLEPVKLKSGKKIYAWSVQGDADAQHITSNTIQVEWPPRSGNKVTIPEVDRAAWCDIEEARIKLNPGQVPLLDQLEKQIKKTLE